MSSMPNPWEVEVFALPGSPVPGGALRVGIHDQDLAALQLQRAGQVSGQRRLTAAAFGVQDAYYTHR